jgi:hypothetical protein
VLAGVAGRFQVGGKSSFYRQLINNLLTMRKKICRIQKLAVPLQRLFIRKTRATA